MIQASDAFIAKMIGPAATVYARIELLDSSENVIDRFDSVVIDGSISVDKQRDYRRQFSITVDNSDGSMTWKPEGRVWIDKRIKFYVGLETPSGIEYVPQGVFLLSEPVIKSAADGTREVTLQGNDKWALFDGAPLGVFTEDRQFDSNSLISTLIRQLASEVGEQKFVFDDCSALTVRETNYSKGESRGKAMKELADMTFYELFYDAYGNLRFTKIIDDMTTQPSVWTYDKNDPTTLYAGTERTISLAEIYNHIVVVYGDAQSETQVYDWVMDSPSDPLSTVNVGQRVFYYNNGSPDETITDADSAKGRAVYEFQEHRRNAERHQFQIAPNYLHEVGDVITLIDDWTGTNDRYELMRFEMGLGPGAMMSCEAWPLRKKVDV